ncbi:BTAD domain-containing putative transcriptional regulator [Streptomyces sp. NPDC047072]|uniref:BTAD domain-containing putative transcriptional regulator n=1 Tax=Streptomyces sp. NPDC047072 TaxID=3154809 RepID=UPI0033C25360
MHSRHGQELRFGVLGPVEVLRDDVPLDLGPRQRRLLLLRLLIEDGRPVSQETLLQDLWPTDRPTGAASSVRAHISRLRSALDPALQGRSALLVSSSAGYALKVDRAARDTTRFDEYVARAREALRGRRLQTARQEVEAALALWRGEPLAEAAEHGFAIRERTRLDGAFQAAKELQGAILVQQGETDLAIDIAEGLVLQAPLRETTWALLMRALYAAGRTVEALQEYERFRDMLATELGLDPSPQLRDLHTAILRHDVTILGTAVTGAALGVAGAAGPFGTAFAPAAAEESFATTGSGAPLEATGPAAASGATGSGGPLAGAGSGGPLANAGPGASSGTAAPGASSGTATPGASVSLDTAAPATSPAASSGTTVAAPSLADAVGPGVALHAVGPVTIPQQSRGPAACAHPVPGPFARTPFVGRGDEMAQLTALLPAAATGRPLWSVIGGEQGSGKTRLVEELSARALAAGFTVARTRAGQALSGNRGISQTCPTVQLLDALRQDGKDSAADETARQDPLATIVHELTQAPTLVVIDDLDQAPQGFHQLLRRLAAILREGPVVFVCALRDSDAPDSSALLGDLALLGATWLTLEPLTVDDVAELLTASGEDAPQETAAALHRRAEGHPFALAELLKLPPVRRVGPRAQVPAALRNLLRARLLELPDQARTMLTYAAADGEWLDLSLLAAVQGLTPDELLPLIDAAVTARILVWDTDPDTGGRPRYRLPALSRDVVLCTQTPSARQLRHAALARELASRDTVDTTRVAHHLHAADLTPPPTPPHQTPLPRKHLRSL